MDASLRQLDTAYGGMLTLSVSGGTMVLTAAQASNPVIQLNGTLSSNQIIAFPPSVAGRRLIIPNVTMGNFALYVRGNNGNDQNGVYFWLGTGFPYGIVVTPSRVFWDYGACGPGTIIDMATAFTGNGWLPCDGRYVSQISHDVLYTYVIGNLYGISGSSFKLPDLRGTVTAMADQIGTIPASGGFAFNAGNRGILNSWGVTTFGGAATHALAVSEMPSHNHGDSGHGHGVSDPQHRHTYTISPGGSHYLPPGSAGVVADIVPTDYEPTGISILTGAANITYAGGGGAFQIVQPTTCTMKMIKW